MQTIKGSCLCGSVNYQSSEKPTMTAVCHCTHCQKQTGTAFSVIVCVPESSLTFSNKDNLANYQDTGDTGGRVDRHFCGKCGSPILSLVESMPGLAFIKAGTLNDTSWLNPTLHVWCDSAQPWVTIDRNATQLAKGSK
jgi:hypothetical protein